MSFTRRFHAFVVEEAQTKIVSAAYSLHLAEQSALLLMLDVSADNRTAETCVLTMLYSKFVSTYVESLKKSHCTNNSTSNFCSRETIFHTYMCAVLCAVVIIQS